MGQVHQMTAGTLRQIVRYLLWDVHADRCQLTALVQYVQKTVSGQTVKLTDLKLTTTVPAKKEHTVDDATVVSSGRLPRALSGEYVPMTGHKKAVKASFYIAQYLVSEPFKAIYTLLP